MRVDKYSSKFYFPDFWTVIISCFITMYSIYGFNFSRFLRICKNYHFSFFSWRKTSFRTIFKEFKYLDFFFWFILFFILLFFFFILWLLFWLFTHEWYYLITSSSIFKSYCLLFISASEYYSKINNFHILCWHYSSSFSSCS